MMFLSADIIFEQIADLMIYNAPPPYTKFTYYKQDNEQECFRLRN